GHARARWIGGGGFQHFRRYVPLDQLALGAIAQGMLRRPIAENKPEDDGEDQANAAENAARRAPTPKRGDEKSSDDRRPRSAEPSARGDNPIGAPAAPDWNPARDQFAARWISARLGHATADPRQNQCPISCRQSR